jgi:hypothetical protein
MEMAVTQFLTWHWHCSYMMELAVAQLLTFGTGSDTVTGMMELAATVADMMEMVVTITDIMELVVTFMTRCYWQ